MIVKNYWYCGSSNQPCFNLPTVCLNVFLILKLYMYIYFIFCIKSTIYSNIFIIKSHESNTASKLQTFQTANIPNCKFDPNQKRKIEIIVIISTNCDHYRTPKVFLCRWNNWENRPFREFNVHTKNGHYLLFHISLS